MIKRYINADAYASTGDDFLGFNMFAYCNNQPVNYIDSSGERPCAGTSDVANATGSSVIATPFSVSFESNGYARAGYESLARNFVDCFDGIWRIYSPDGSVNNLKEGIILG